jgi:glycosidase
VTATWHVYPLGFTGAPLHPEPGVTPLVHRLPLLTSWLEYARDLGIDTLLLGPIFASASHGYDTIDYFRIDPRLGDQADFDHLVATAHSLGIRVYLDGVFNHVGDQYPAYLEAAAQGSTSAAARLFRWSDGYPYNFEGSPSLITLNHDVPEVQGLITHVMRHWLALGADGWRLDAAYAVPTDFWARVLPAVRTDHPDAFVFGEVIHGDYAGFVRQSGADSVTQYELWKAIWSSLKDSNFWELSASLTRHNALLETFSPVTFVSNHDVTRIASQVGERRAVLAAVALMTVGGLPAIYYGDEQGFTGVKEDGPFGDDAVRPPFPPTPADLYPGGWEMYRRYQALIAIRRERPWLEGATTRDLVLTNERYVYLVQDPAVPGQHVKVELSVEDPTHPRARVWDSSGREIFQG